MGISGETDWEWDCWLVETTTTTTKERCTMATMPPPRAEAMVTARAVERVNRCVLCLLVLYNQRRKISPKKDLTPNG